MKQSVHCSCKCYFCKEESFAYSVTLDGTTAHIESVGDCPECGGESAAAKYLFRSLLAARQGVITNHLRLQSHPAIPKHTVNARLSGDLRVSFDTVREANLFWNNLLISASTYKGVLTVENAVWQSLPERREMTEELERDMRSKIPQYAETLEQVSYTQRKTDDHPQGSYQYVPLPRALFMSMHDMFAKLGAVPKVGCDLGAGLGNGVLHLPLICEESCGVEINSQYIASAPETLRSRIKQGDILTEDLTPYDLLYFYRPFDSYHRETDFERGLAARMKPGAYLVPMYSNNCFPDLRLMALEETGCNYKVPIYQKPL